MGASCGIADGGCWRPGRGAGGAKRAQPCGLRRRPPFLSPASRLPAPAPKNNRYVRLLGAFYLRLVGRPAEVYQYLEPLLNDYRKVRRGGERVLWGECVRVLGGVGGC